MSELTHNFLPTKKTFKSTAAIAAATMMLMSCSEKVDAAPHEVTPTTTTTADKEWVSKLSEIPAWVDEKYPVKKPVDCLVEKCIALTFDDGPGAYTDHLLDILKQHDVHATFFLLGSLAETHADTVRRMEAEGHEVGNHSWNHKYLPGLGAEAAAADVARAEEAIGRLIGHPPLVMRPPYGSTNQGIIDAIGLPEIIWDVDPEDWKYKSTSHLVNHILSHEHKGAIMLMHDIYDQTVEGVEPIIDGLQADGYTLVTIDELLGGTPPVGKYFSQDNPKRP